MVNFLGVVDVVFIGFGVVIVVFIDRIFGFGLFFGSSFYFVLCGCVFFWLVVICVNFLCVFDFCCYFVVSVDCGVWWFSGCGYVYKF